jgi:hypothetical protein
MWKLVLAWPASWFCYWVGDLYCRIMELWDNNEYWVAFWYPLYNDFMIDSSTIQDWAGGTKYFPWGAPDAGT